MSARKFSAALFDLDGVLLDTMPLWNSLAFDYLHSKGKEPKASLTKELAALSLQQAALFLKEKYDLKESAGKIYQDLCQRIEDFYLHTAPLKPGAEPLIRALHQNGVKLILVSSCQPDLAAAALKRTGIDGYFSHLLFTETFGKGKDEPEIFEYAASLAGCSTEECAVLEDSLYALCCAKNAGFFCFSIADSSQKADAMEIEKSADICLSGLQDTAGILKHFACLAQPQKKKKKKKKTRGWGELMKLQTRQTLSIWLIEFSAS
jgi:HAD superfamily hydrolase (TIGR01509 family)